LAIAVHDVNDAQLPEACWISPALQSFTAHQATITLSSHQATVKMGVHKGAVVAGPSSQNPATAHPDEQTTYSGMPSTPKRD
jgi:hypothetical protein